MPPSVYEVMKGATLITTNDSKQKTAREKEQTKYHKFIAKHPELRDSPAKEVVLKMKEAGIVAQSSYWVDCVPREIKLRQGIYKTASQMERAIETNSKPR